MVKSPVISQSEVVLPPPCLSAGSLLVTEMILHRARWQLSIAEALNVTGCIRWFGGQSTSGSATMPRINGNSQSRTITRKLQVSVTCPAEFVAVHNTVFVPTEKNDPEGGTQEMTWPSQFVATGG